MFGISEHLLFNSLFSRSMYMDAKMSSYRSTVIAQTCFCRLKGNGQQILGCVESYEVCAGNQRGFLTAPVFHIK